jgi:hypothetical protein
MAAQLAKHNFAVYSHGIRIEEPKRVGSERKQKKQKGCATNSRAPAAEFKWLSSSVTPPPPATYDGEVAARNTHSSTAGSM